MARLPRFVLPGQPQHVIQRGNNRSVLFFCDDDYNFYKHCLETAGEQHGCQIHAYVLMTNHVHLLVTPQTENGISKLMQSVGRRYVQYINYCYRRSGTLWEGRYKATLIDTELYLLACHRYIEMNPVRAAMITMPGEYPWSSHPANAYGKVDSLVQSHTLYLALGESPVSRQAAYRQLFNTPESEDSLREIREATNKAWVLGSERFKQDIQDALNRRVAPQSRGGSKKKKKQEPENFELPICMNGMNGMNGVMA